MTEEFPDHEIFCAACKSKYHPASGHVLSVSPLVVLCGPCAIDHKKWYKGMVNRKWGKKSFYGHASQKPVDDAEVWVKYVPEKK